MNKIDHDIRAYINAVRFAHDVHAGQRYGDAPYTYHLAHVENVLTRFGFLDMDFLAAAWLHDTVEDGEGVTVESIRAGYNATVARLVDSVTDGEGKNRKERKAASYAKLREYPYAIPLKLADRIANVESCVHERKDGLFEMYRKEHEEFRAQLHHADLTTRTSPSAHSTRGCARCGRTSTDYSLPPLARPERG